MKTATNCVTLFGRAAQDPTFFPGEEGKSPLCNLNLAVSRARDKEGNRSADFIPCKIWGKGAEIINQYVKKGQALLINGRIQTGKYEKEGQTHYTTDVVIENFEFVNTRNSATSAGANDGAEANNAASEGGFMEIPDGIEDEIPFV